MTSHHLSAVQQHDFSAHPPTLTLPTGGRGGAALPTQALTRQNRRVPSPRWGGLGWGALEKLAAT